jgi:hypothetical protein
MISRDGRSPEDIERLIRWCQQDSFWYKNVRSMRKLRLQFERLDDDSRDPNRNRTRAPRRRDNMASRLDRIIAEGDC